MILYYLFTPLSDPEAIRLWQRTLCQSLGLSGRILIADHGINGTLGGEVSQLKRYVSATKSYPAFKSIVFKWSEAETEPFSKLIVKIRPEIVTFGVPKRIEVTDHGIVGGGQKLKPHQVNQLVAERGDEVVFFDGRNRYEAEIGRFKNAIVTDVNHTREFKQALKDPSLEPLKHRPIITYCTGGIRCEVLTVLMKDEGFKEVYQIDGGIVKYGQTYKDDGLWEGSLYVFDGRMDTKFSDRAKDIGSCVYCRSKTSNYDNCVDADCNKLVLVCQKCREQNHYCPKHPVSTEKKY